KVGRCRGVGGQALQPHGVERPHRITVSAVSRPREARAAGEFPAGQALLSPGNTPDTFADMAGARGGGGTRARRDPGRRRALLEAADRVIQREGPEASMAAIAAEAGISKPILYRHFGDKSGLYQALAERHTRKLIEGIRAEFSRDEPVRDRARSTIDNYLATISKNLHLY